jgi:hypothetical protein
MTITYTYADVINMIANSIKGKIGGIVIEGDEWDVDENTPCISVYIGTGTRTVSVAKTMVSGEETTEKGK